MKTEWIVDEATDQRLRLTADDGSVIVELYPDEVAAIVRASRRRPPSGRPGVTSRVSGHELQREGQPIEAPLYTRGTGGKGRAKCSCGAKSPVLPSANKRKEWHRQHKADVLAEAAS